MCYAFPFSKCDANPHFPEIPPSDGFSRVVGQSGVAQIGRQADAG